MRNCILLLYTVWGIVSGCTHYPSSIVLHPEKVITQYNDTTFNSTGFITPFNNGYLIADYGNKFIAAVDKDIENLDIIGKLGKGPDEYPVLPSSYISVDKDIFMYDYKKTLYKYDLQSETRIVINIDSIADFIKSRSVYYKDNCLIFATLPGQTCNFVSYDLSNGNFEYFHTNPTLSKLRQRNTYTALLNNGVFIVIEYADREGSLYTFSISDETINKKVQIPLNHGILNILQTAPQAPAFDGICVWRDRVFIAYNSTGLVTTRLDASGQSDGWIFIDYPEDKAEDHVILSNFCATEKNLIFFNQGLLRFYENPFK